MKPLVFVSAGTPADEAQQSFRDAIVRSMETAGLRARLMGDKDWDYKNPLRGLRRAMKGCTGAIVIAYTRYEFPSGSIRRSGEIEALEETSFPTAWNQIEAAMAYEKGLPLLVIGEIGLRKDAIFEESGDIRPYWTAVDASVCTTDGFLGYLQSWREDVVELAESSRNLDEAAARKVSLRSLIGGLAWNESIALWATLIGILIGTLTVGYRIGAGQWPF